MNSKPITESWRARCQEVAAQLWCLPTTSMIEMDVRLAMAFANKLAEETSQPWLGNATTQELLDEIAARVDISYYTAQPEFVRRIRGSTMKISKGQLIAITNGEYSDYCLRDHMRALQDFNAHDEAERFKKTDDYLSKNQYSAGRPSKYGSDMRFLAWLIRENIVEPLEHGTVVELYIGSDKLEIKGDVENGA